MSIVFFASTLLLVTIIFAPVNPQNAVRSYVVKKDFFSGVKAGEFSIFDRTEQQLQYRLESQYSFLQSIELVAYPSKQVLAKLKKNLKLLLYKATISILDPNSNQWIDGKIEEHFKMFGDKFTIEWNGQRVLMEGKFGSLNTDFRDEKQGTLLAQYRIQLLASLLANKYELQVFSDKLPDAIYFLGLVARDHKISQASKNSKGKKRYTDN